MLIKHLNPGQHYYGTQKNNTGRPLYHMLIKHLNPGQHYYGTQKNNTGRPLYHMLIKQPQPWAALLWDSKEQYR